MTTSLELAGKGFAAIDQEKADDPQWVWSVDLDKLDICSLDECILGQAYGSYGYGRGMLHRILGHEWTGSEYGFDSPTAKDHGPLSYSALRKAWIVLLEKARKERPKV